jgi:hypothetical protein
MFLAGIIDGFQVLLCGHPCFSHVLIAFLPVCLLRGNIYYCIAENVQGPDETLMTDDLAANF